MDSRCKMQICKNRQKIEKDIYQGVKNIAISYIK
jgi:hypothetical protein